MLDGFWATEVKFWAHSFRKWCPTLRFCACIDVKVQSFGVGGVDLEESPLLESGCHDDGNITRAAVGGWTGGSCIYVYFQPCSELCSYEPSLGFEQRFDIHLQ